MTTDTPTIPPVVTEHVRVRWRQRFGGGDMLAAWTRAEPVRLAVLRREAKACGGECHLKPGAAFYRDGLSRAVFVVLVQGDSRPVLATVVRWKFKAKGVGR